MRFDTKIAIAVRADLEPWQKLNVTAFLASGIAAGAADVMGKPYEDGSGNTYLELFRQPVVVYAADGPALSQAHQRALARGHADGHLHHGHVRDRPRRRQPGRGPRRGRG